MEFKDSLVEGKFWEHKFLTDVVFEKYPKSVVIDGYFKGYDIEVKNDNGEKVYSVEVKSDLKSIHTGNFVIEVFMGKPSALSTTTADYWAFTDGKRWYILPPERIWRCILDNRYRVVEFVGSGDIKAKYAYLVKVKDLEKLAKTIEVEES